MKSKFTALTDQLYRYVCACRSNADDPVLEALRKETEMLGDVSRMQISREQGGFLTLLAAAIAAKSAVEIGTFTGYSAISIARGLVEGGRLLAVDRSEEWTAIARKYWNKASVENKIELRIGEAICVLKNLEPDAQFDFAFIDGDKTEYDAYFELVLPRVRQNGLILFDNMLWGGRLDDGKVENPDGQAIHVLNQKLARDPRVQAVLIPVADGIQICRKR